MFCPDALSESFASIRLCEGRGPFGLVKFYFLSAGDVTLWGAGWGLGEKWLRDFDKERPLLGVGKRWKEKALG